MAERISTTFVHVVKNSEGNCDFSRNLKEDELCFQRRTVISHSADGGLLVFCYVCGVIRAIADTSGKRCGERESGRVHAGSNAGHAI